jgi:replication factor A1
MQGESMYGHIPAKQIEKKDSLLDLDKAYLISKFHVKNSRTAYVPFVKEFMIEFTGLTTVQTVRDPPDGLPEYVYNITPYSELNPNHPHSTVYVGNSFQHIHVQFSGNFTCFSSSIIVSSYIYCLLLADVLGIITSSGTVVQQRVGNQEKPVPMREIVIKNLRYIASSVCLTDIMYLTR